MSEDDASAIPPGWYQDPADETRLRRWDGEGWTQEVMFDPDAQPAAAAVAPEPPQPVHEPAPPIIHEPAAPIYHEPAAPIIHEPSPPAAEPAPPPFQQPGQPPVGQPVPPSPAPTFAPPGATDFPPTTPEPAPAPPSPPSAPSVPPAPPVQPAQPAPTMPRPSPPVSHPNPPSGPVSLPEWATLPGLTLPPDLSSILGSEGNSVLHPPTFAEPEPREQDSVLNSPHFSQPDPRESNSVLHPPTFAEPESRELPTLPAFEPPFIPQRPDVQDVGRSTSTAPAKTKQDAPPQPATPYAPPPSGAQYDVPPPPGMAHVPSTGNALPPSAFVAPQLPSARPTLPPVNTSPLPPGPLPAPDVAQGVGVVPPPAPGLGTVWIWLIAALPLIQLAVIFVVFQLLKVPLAPGMQWGILAAPAAFSLLFANADKKALTNLDAPSPHIAFGLIPPLYLIVRCVTTGLSSLGPLVAWVVLQAAAAVSIYFVLPTVLAEGIRSFG